MATIGRRAAVTQFRSGRLLRGTLGWLAWLGLHLVYLIGLPQQDRRARQLVVALPVVGFGPRIIVSEESVADRRQGAARRLTGPPGHDPARERARGRR